MLYDRHILELDCNRSHLVSAVIPGEYMVYGINHKKKVCRISRVSEQSGEVLAYWDGMDETRRFNRCHGG